MLFSIFVVVKKFHCFLFLVFVLCFLLGLVEFFLLSKRGCFVVLRVLCDCLFLLVRINFVWFYCWKGRAGAIISFNLQFTENEEEL